MLTEAILAHGQRTVSAILRVTGLGNEERFWQLSSGVESGTLVAAQAESVVAAHID